MRTRVKICGITNVADAVMAAEAGADAIGVVLYPSAKRCVSVATAREIVRAVGPYVTVVGLFVDQPTAEIERTCDEAGIGLVQLQGHESAEQVGELAGYPVVKAVRVVKGKLEQEIEKWREAIGRLELANLKGLLMETDAKQPGGTGIANDWGEIARAREAGAFAGMPAMIAAGGLRPENLGEVIRTVRPWAVDVSSGVEGEFGKKSAEKIRRFIEAARAE